MSIECSSNSSAILARDSAQSIVRELTPKNDWQIMVNTMGYTRD